MIHKRLIEAHFEFGKLFRCVRADNSGVGLLKLRVVEED